MSEKEQLLMTWQREVATTGRVLAAFPAQRTDFRPHPRSSSALEIAWTLHVAYTALADLVLGSAPEFKPTPAPPPDRWDAVLKALERSQEKFIRDLGSCSPALLAQPIRVPVGPNQMAEVPRGQMVWMLLLDQVHHRGQLSVYLRMAGGKVPSIYGPSADEQWPGASASAGPGPGDQRRTAAGRMP